MTDDKYRAPESGTLQGCVMRPESAAELVAAIEAAFDYRGDVTLEMRDGSKFEGYVSNRNAAATPPVVELFPKGQPGVRVIAYADIAAITFSGTDPASGKSWEVWAAKKESQRRAEADRVIADAQARGHL
jgi:hypothetical protein